MDSYAAKRESTGDYTVEKLIKFNFMINVLSVDSIKEKNIFSKNLKSTNSKLPEHQWD